MPAEDNVPTWDGDPASFEAFVTACKWHASSLKESERKLAASRVWQRLRGAAKSVVKHLDPADYDSLTGLHRLIEVLRASPLQRLPVPDSFSRLEKWSNMKRLQNETIPQLLVREEELFTELQQGLQRARTERAKMSTTGVGTSRERDPPTSPSRSPTGPQGAQPADDDGAASVAAPVSLETDFFGDELRGYRLLKAARLSSQERQHVLTLTSNSTRFVDVRRALRTLFAEEVGAEDQRRKIWFQETASSWDAGDEYDEGPGWPDEWWSAEEEAYWYDDASWAYYYEDDEDYSTDGSWQDDWDWTDGSPKADDTSDLGSIPEHERYQEAFTIAQEANKTLSEARQAVAKVRAARGYFDPAGMKGSTSKGSKGKGKTKGKPRTALGPCFICGSTGHGYLNCPDRYSAYGGSPKGSKGKGKKGAKGKQKGKFSQRQVNYAGDYFVDIEQYKEIVEDDNLQAINVLSLENDNAANCINAFKAIIDTGATESVCGVTAMARMIDSIRDPEYHVVLHDRPTFRFGNGHTQQATSRLDIMTKALKMVSFYLLDGHAEMTPPLLGGRELWNRNAVVAYCGEYFAHQAANGAWWTNPLIRLRGRHVAIDLDEEPSSLGSWINHLQRPLSPDDDDGDYGDGGGEDGPSSGNRRPRQRDPGQEHAVHDAVRRAANRANGFAPPDNTPADAPPEQPPQGDRGDAGPAGGAAGGAAGGGDGLHREPDEVEAVFGPRRFGDDVKISEVMNLDGTDSESLEVTSFQHGRAASSSTCRVPWCSGNNCRHKPMKRELEPDDSPSDRNSKPKSFSAASGSTTSQKMSPIKTSLRKTATRFPKETMMGMGVVLEVKVMEVQVLF